MIEKLGGVWLASLETYLPGYSISRHQSELASDVRRVLKLHSNQPSSWSQSQAALSLRHAHTPQSSASCTSTCHC